MHPAIAAFLLLVTLAPAAGPTAAADVPEAVYARFHRAVLAGNLAEMKRNGTAAGGAEIDKLPPDQSKAILGFMRKLMPTTYTITGTDINPNGASATLRATARAADTAAGGTGNIRGTIRMLKERGEWKVEESNWEGSGAGLAVPPEVLGAMLGAQQGGKAPAAASPKKPQAAAPTRRTPVVGALDSAPERKLGAAKPPCVYKPVMTDQDIENCR